jgi:hypothetical protein
VDWDQADVPSVYPSGLFFERTTGLEPATLTLATSHDYSPLLGQDAKNLIRRVLAIWPTPLSVPDSTPLGHVWGTTTACWLSSNVQQDVNDLSASSASLLTDP